LVIDELGKFLEYAAREQEQGDVFVLQELAEASAGSPGLCLVTILHQAFERYAADLPASAREEWGKIQGRYEDIAFQEPPEQLIDLLAHAIGHVSDPVTRRLEASARKIAEVAAGLGLAPRGLTKQQFVHAMVRCSPIHPLAVLGLVRLCRKFGQHQRSLFSFLVSNEPHGFSEFCQRPVEGEGVPWYRLDTLYDYVAEALGNGLSMGESATRWAEVQGALDSAVALPESERRIIKTVGLLSAVGAYGEFKPTTDLLSFAGEDPKAVRQDLDALVKRSIMVYRRHSQCFGLWQGSDIDLEARLVEARRRCVTDRLRTTLDMRLSQADTNSWLFPAKTKSGHIEASSLRKQHAKALKASGVAPFELYILRHTCLTRWSKWMDPFTFHRVAGHTDMKTTMRYVHPSDADMDEALVKARDAQGGHTSGHTRNAPTVGEMKAPAKLQ
jgi:hypothetical protein